jgi:DHA1 family tetracycline resistance protein-like MFS transporter
MLSKKFSFISVFSIVFLDMLGVGIIIPVLTPLFLNFNLGILSSGHDLQTRTLILGLLLATYSIAQFFGAPILGALSDKYGRRPVLLFTVSGTTLGYTLLALGVMTNTLWLLFVARLVHGFAGGNVSVVQSSIADVSDVRAKTRNFALIAMAFGLGFIIGPYMGGKLSDASVVSWFSFATPFWFAAILSLVNLGQVAASYAETLHTKVNTRISMLTGIRNIGRAFTMPKLYVVFLALFLMTFGFSFFTQFSQIFLIEKFKFTQGMIGDFFAYIGLFTVVSQGLIVRPLSRKFLPEQILPWSMLGLAVAFVLLLIPDKVIGLYLLVPLVAIFQGLNQPSTTATISNLSDASSQGEIMGIQQSIQSAAQALPPLVGGLTVSLHLNLPIIMAAATTGVAWLLFVILFQRGNGQVFHEV